MTRDSITYQFDYEIDFDYKLGYSGSNRAPETHDIQVVNKYDNYEGKFLNGYEINSMLGNVEEEINDYLNNLLKKFGTLKKKYYICTVSKNNG